MHIKKSLFLLCFTISISSCNFFSNDSELINEAEKALSIGDTNKANLYAKKLLKQNANNGHARFIMAETATLRGNMTNAETDYRRAYEAGYDIRKVLPPFIDNLMLLKKHNDIPELLKNLPENMQSHKSYWMGLFYLGDNYLDKANNSFEKSINASNSNFAKPFFGKALIAIEKNDYKSAFQYIDKALAIDEKYLDALLMKAELHTKENQDNLALPTLLSLLDQNVNIIPAKKHFIIKSILIQIYWRREDINLAEKHVYDLLKRYKGNPVANYYGAMVNFKRGKYSAANNFLQAVLRISPDHVASLGLMGSVKYQQGFYEQADFYLSSALANHSNDPELSKLLAATRLKQNQTSSAIGLLDSTSTKDSDPLILWLSGKAEIQAGNTDNGLKLLKKAAAISKNSESMQLDIAQTYLSMGKLDKAISELDNLSNNNVIDKQKDLFVIYDNIQKSNFNDALREIKLLIIKNPDDLKLQIALGNIYIAMQQNDKAIEAFKKAAKDEIFIKANLLLSSVYIEESRFNLAKQSLKAIIDIENNNFEALSGLIRIAHLENNQKEYQKSLTELQTKHSQNPNAFLIEARQQLSNKDFINAENTLKKVIQLDEKNVTGILMLTSCYTQAEKINPAIFFLEGKLNIPELKKIPHLHYQLARLYEINNNTGKALKSIKRAFTLKPNNADYLFSYTKLLKKNGKDEQILYALESFITENPKSTQGHVLLGDFLFSEGYFNQALSAYLKAELIEPSEQLAIKLSRAREKLKKDTASDSLEQWLLSYPEATLARVELARYRLTNGEFKKAIKEYEILTKKQPNNPALLNNLAWAYQQVNNRLALPTAEKAYNLVPNSPEIADTYGWILVNMGKLANGLKVLNKAYIGKSKSIDIQYHLAYALVKSRQYNKAQKLLQAILNNESAKALHAPAKKLLNDIP